MFPIIACCYSAKLFCRGNEEGISCCISCGKRIQEFLIFAGIFHALQACYMSATFPCDVTCPEVESFCYVHQANAWIDKKLVSELNRRGQAIFDP
jgi:hypothetical protein